MRRAFCWLLLASLPLACGSTEQDPSSGVIFEKGGAGGTTSAGGTSGKSGNGQAGTSSPAGGQAGSGQAGQGQAGQGQAGSGQAGQGNAGSGTAGSGQAGQGNAGSGQAGQGNAGSGQAGQGNAGSGQAGAPAVHIVSPADGSTVDNPVAFSLQAQGVDSVGLVADGQYSLPLDGWQVSTAASYDFSYTFSSTGMRSLTLSGYLAGSSAPAATDTISITIPDPLPPALCDGVSLASFEPPTSCNGPKGQTSKQIPSNGVFSTSWFGCYRKADGSIYQDPTDNCEFACGDKGLCGGNQGPDCEANLKWFAADADRFGCGSRIRVTNCVNNLSVVLTTLDRGPNCSSVEQAFSAPVLDMSHDAMVYLFEGKTYGGDDHKRVVIEQVDPSTPLGPVN
jgi:hypothetical protein